jgi:hypothetical protein
MRHVLTAIAALSACPVMANNCAPHDQMVAVLGQQYGETRVSAALDLNNYLIEVFANETSGTWTALLTTPDMQACIAAAGTNYEDVRESPGIDG